MKSILLILLFFFAIVVSYGQTLDTLHVYFDLDNVQLNARGSRLLDSIVKDERLRHNQKITIVGYSDYLGSDAYAKTISEARAKNVEDYIVLAGYNRSDIVRCLGKGKIKTTPVKGKVGIPDDRKVDIVFDARKDTSDELRFQCDLVKMKVNETLPIRNIEFYNGSLDMTPQSIPWLERLLYFLQKNDTIIFQLEGHVCCIGPNDGRDEHYDEGTLSQKRAQVIYDYLAKNGIRKERMKAIGLGNLNPVYMEESNEENEKLSRRVELRIMSK